ncbi:MAG: DUF2779 domain-containing protein [bacterium]
MKLISKSRFLEYLMCPKDAWFRLNRPELEQFEVPLSQQNIMDQGNTVEEYAKGLFPGFVEVKNHDFSASKEIEQLMAQKVPAIYQPTFVADGYIIRCDFLVWNSETKKWDIYEVKASSSKKDDDGPRDHISDLAFQVIVLERAGIDIGKKFIVHINNKYVRDGEIDIKKLFIIDDSTDQVSAKKAPTAKQMEEAKEYLNQTKEPAVGCDCHYYGRRSHCATFEISHPEFPEYSIHDLSRITSKKLTKLVKDGIYHLHEIADTKGFTETQKNQIHTHKTEEEIIDRKEISYILDEYTYPLYFFDYETFAPAVPAYSGFRPYQRIPIQFSMHIIDQKGGPLRHVDYLHEENSDPSEAVAKLLEKIVDPKGTVLAWNVSFEKGVTKEIGLRLPKYEKVLNRICRQMKDLRDVFSKQHYVHKDFGGSSGIESVMTVLLPKMSYDHLPYTGNDVGFVWWGDIVNKGEEPKDRANKIYLIKEYCKQDTFVMVEIFRILNEVINNK